MTYVFWDIARMLYPNKWKYRNSEFRNKALFFEEMHIFIFREAWKKFPNLNGKKTDFSSSTKVYKFTKNQYFNFLKKINYIQSLRLLCNFDTFWKKFYTLLSKVAVRSFLSLLNGDCCCWGLCWSSCPRWSKSKVCSFIVINGSSPAIFPFPAGELELSLSSFLWQKEPEIRETCVTNHHHCPSTSSFRTEN